MTSSQKSLWSGSGGDKTRHAQQTSIVLSSDFVYDLRSRWRPLRRVSKGLVVPKSVPPWWSVSCVPSVSVLSGRGACVSCHSYDFCDVGRGLKSLRTFQIRGTYYPVCAKTYCVKFSEFSGHFLTRFLSRHVVPAVRSYFVSLQFFSPFFFLPASPRPWYMTGVLSSDLGGRRSKSTRVPST